MSKGHDVMFFFWTYPYTDICSLGLSLSGENDWKSIVLRPVREVVSDPRVLPSIEHQIIQYEYIYLIRINNISIVNAR